MSSTGDETYRVSSVLCLFPKYKSQLNPDFDLLGHSGHKAEASLESLRTTNLQAARIKFHLCSQMFCSAQACILQACVCQA